VVAKDGPKRTTPVVDLIGLRFQRGDPAAAQEIRQRVRRILAYRGYGFSREARRDLEQDVMTQLWQAVHQPRTDLGIRFWGFVETVTARRAIDRLRVRRKHVALDERMAGGPDPLAQTLARERADLARAVLERLPESCRRLIWLQLGEGRNYREISKILGKSDGALRVEMYRCIRKGRELLEELRSSGDEETSIGGET
jgi:RNA polymerase sigma factor (sigma-70 family)